MAWELPAVPSLLLQLLRHVVTAYLPAFLVIEAVGVKTLVSGFQVEFIAVVSLAFFFESVE